MTGGTRPPRLCRVAVALAYWLTVLVVSAVLVMALLWLLEGRDASSLDTAASAVARRAGP